MAALAIRTAPILIAALGSLMPAAGPLLAPGDEARAAVREFEESAISGNEVTVRQNVSLRAN